MPISFVISGVVPAPVDEVFSAWLDGDVHTQMTGGEATCDPVVGGRFTAWDGYIEGTTIEIEAPTRIVQAWRTSQFPEGAEDSRLVITFEEDPGGTKITFEHSNIPPHDADYEQWPEEHPRRIVAWLEERGEPELAHAISAHYTKWGVEYRSDLDRALVACDELTGFLMACAYLRPDGIATLTPKSVKKKLKDRKFAAGVEREEVQAGLDLLGVELADHVQFLVAALTPHAEELGIAGSGAASA